MIIATLLLNNILLYGQAAVEIPLSVSNGSSTIQLAAGLDLMATNGIDPEFGESDLPPFPPSGTFEFRFDLTPYAGEPLSTYKDIRAPGDPPSFLFSDTVQHRIIWQKSESGLPIDIHYSLPSGCKMVVQDEFGGVLLNVGPFEGVGTTTIPGSLSLNSSFLYLIYNDISPVEIRLFTDELSLQYLLAQNYPNPFNPNTVNKICFTRDKKCRAYNLQYNRRESKNTCLRDSGGRILLDYLGCYK